MTEPPANILKAPVNKTRLEFLYDGVFAIAMTILVLELKVPELADRRSAAELLRGLAHDAPAFGAWLLSIVMLGIFWYQHPLLYRWLERVTRALLVVHLGLMATAAFFPFCAALMGRFPANRVAALAYLACAGVHVTLIAMMWLVADRQRALSPHVAPAEIRRVRRRYLRGPILILLWSAIYLLVMPRP